MTHAGGKSRKINNEIIWYSAIFIAALALRVHFVINVDYPLMGDGENYLSMARRLTNGGAYGYLSELPDAYVTPGYPLFLAFFLSLFGESGGLLPIQLGQCLLGSITAVLCVMIGKRLHSLAAGAMAGLIIAVYPPFIMSCLCLLTECLYLFVFILYFYLQLLSLDPGREYSHSRRILLSGLCGALFALSVLIRPTAFPLAFLPFLYRLVTARRHSKREIRIILTEAASFFVCGALVMLPWWVRNILVLGEFVLLSSGGGNPLLFGTFPDMLIPEGFYLPREEEMAAAIERIKNGFLNEPLRYLYWYTAGKFKYIFFNIWYYLPGPVSPPFHNWYLPFVHYFSVVSGWLAAGFSPLIRPLRFTALYAAALTALQLCFIPNERYAYTVLPLLIICASVFTVHCFHLLKRERRIIYPHI
ncbi:MAG: glycosyltransferase family 39 protein [Clostridia bacterium]|nr:glycosyltransferase family 39 protein [Clostridia bacterium]